MVECTFDLVKITLSKFTDLKSVQVWLYYDLGNIFSQILHNCVITNDAYCRLNKPEQLGDETKFSLYANDALVLFFSIVFSFWKEINSAGVNR